MRVFVISKPNTDGSMNSKDPDEEVKRYPSSWSIPAIELIQDPRDGGGGETWIAAVKGEKTCFVDEMRQKDVLDKIAEKRIRLPKITFTEGRRKVEDSNVSEWMFLQYTTRNQKNHNGVGVKRTFFEYEPQEFAKKRIEAEMADIEMKSSIITMNANKLKAVARVTGAVNTTQAMETIDPTVLQHSLIAKLHQRGGKELVKKAMQDPNLEYRFDIYEALDKDMLAWNPANPFELDWKSGGVVCMVPAGTKDKVEYVAGYLYENGFETLQTIRKVLGRVVEETSQKEVVQNDTGLKDWLRGATNGEIIDKMIAWNKDNPDYTLFTFKGPYMAFGETRLSADSSQKGKEGAKEFLLDNPEIYQEVYKVWVKYVL